jgi:rare lipoprotein A
MNPTRIIAALGAATVLGACSGAAPEDSAGETARPAILDSTVLAGLVGLYPRLGREPLPAPRPQTDRSGGEGSLETTTGEATYYARYFEGRRTASGLPFRQNQMVAAHRAYPFGTILRVTNTANQRSVNVRVVDRGPFGNSAAARRTVIDLSRRAAGELGYLEGGRARVRVEVLEWGPGLPS